MMISEDPDEDADTLDDESLLRRYLGVGTKASGDQVGIIPDWPASAGAEVGLSVDSETSDWFKRNHDDWRRAMRLVLRAWVAAQTRDSQAEP